MKKLITLVASVIVVMAVSCRALGGEGASEKASPEKPSVEVIAVTVHAAAAPTPALRFQLLPTFLESRPGNAVPYYAKAFIFREQIVRAMQHKDELYLNSVVKWLEAPLDAVPRDHAHEIVNAFRGTLDQVELAVLRERCDWDLPLREGNVFDILLPECQCIRDLGRLVALRARLQIAEGKYTEAIASLRTGYAMARQVAEAPLLVNGLVAMTIVRMMNKQALTLCQQRGAPNLCWSLTALPHPILDFRYSLGMEYEGLYLQFPPLRTVRGGQFGPEQWNRLLLDFIASMVPSIASERTSPVAASQKDKDAVDVAAIATGLLNEVPTAKQELASAGYSREELNAMAPAQIVLLHMVLTYDRLRDNMFKFGSLPYWQASQGMLASDRDVEWAKKQTTVPLASMSVSNLAEAAFSFAQVEREIAALRCIEALRLYAAAHDGKLPATLDEIKEVPIPLNPVTGKAFGYRVEGSTAVLDADGGPAGTPWPQYRITLAK
jgi:hypothetical protein